MIYLDEQAIEEIALGAAVLGTGGGGDPYIGKVFAQRMIRKYGAVQLLEPNEIPDDALCISSSGMGAPTVMVEKIPAEEEYLAPFRTLEKYLGRKADIVFPIECGGINSMIPFIVAAQAGIPVADIDGMGRAFPELQMITFHLYGYAVTPLVMGDCRSNSVLMETINNFWTENIARSITVQMGGQASMADTPLTGAQLKEAGIHSPVALSRRIGKTILDARKNDTPPTEAVAQVCGGQELFVGKVIDIIRTTDGAFVRGKAILEGLESYKGDVMELEFQNENLVARVGNKVLASVPDLICNLELSSGIPVTTEGLRFGQRIMVLGIPCDDKWRSEKGLKVVGPRAFGYDFDFNPLTIKGGL